MKPISLPVFAALIALSAMITGNAVAGSGAVADQTIGWWSTLTNEAKTKLSSDAAAALREDHPGLTGYYIRGCLDDVAGSDNTQQLNLGFAIAGCANWPDNH
jgi:hypothetical protein